MSDAVTTLASIVTAVAMVVLVSITWLYARRTGEMVSEMRIQRAETARQQEERRKLEILSLRHGLSTELRGFIEMIEGKQGEGRLFMKLPRDAWHAVSNHPDALSHSLREKLYSIYAEAERMNAITNLMLSPRPRSSGFEDSGLGLTRRTDSEFLARSIREALDMLAALPPPN